MVMDYLKKWDKAIWFGVYPPLREVYRLGNCYNIRPVCKTKQPLGVDHENEIENGTATDWRVAYIVRMNVAPLFCCWNSWLLTVQLLDISLWRLWGKELDSLTSEWGFSNRIVII